MKSIPARPVPCRRRHAEGARQGPLPETEGGAGRPDTHRRSCRRPMDNPRFRLHPRRPQTPGLRKEACAQRDQPRGAELMPQPGEKLRAVPVMSADIEFRVFKPGYLPLEKPPAPAPSQQHRFPAARDADWRAWLPPRRFRRPWLCQQAIRSPRAGWALHGPGLGGPVPSHQLGLKRDTPPPASITT